MIYPTTEISFLIISGYYWLFCSETTLNQGGDTVFGPHSLVPGNHWPVFTYWLFKNLDFLSQQTPSAMIFFNYYFFKPHGSFFH